MPNRSAPLLIAAALMALPLSAHAEVRRGPYPNTALSRGGELIWYTGVIDVAGHRWSEMDTLCRHVPITEVSGWRAPSEAEVRTLFTNVQRRNAVTTWTEIYPANPAALTPAVPLYVNVGPNRPAPHMNILLRNLYTYEGQPTTLAQVRRGSIYVVSWFGRWIQPWLTREQSITHTPGEQRLGPSDRLLCVAERSGS